MPDRPYFWWGLLLGPARHDSPRKSWMGKVGGESVPGSSSCRPIAVEGRRKRLTGINREKLGIPIQPINRSTDQPISPDDYDYRVTTAFRKSRVIRAFLVEKKTSITRLVDYIGNGPKKCNGRVPKNHFLYVLTITATSSLNSNKFTVVETSSNTKSESSSYVICPKVSM